MVYFSLPKIPEIQGDWGIELNRNFPEQDFWILGIPCEVVTCSRKSEWLEVFYSIWPFLLRFSFSDVCWLVFALTWREWEVKLQILFRLVAKLFETSNHKHLARWKRAQGPVPHLDLCSTCPLLFVQSTGVRKLSLSYHCHYSVGSISSWWANLCVREQCLPLTTTWLRTALVSLLITSSVWPTSSRICTTTGR